MDSEYRGVAVFDRYKPPALVFVHMTTSAGLPMVEAFLVHPDSSEAPVHNAWVLDSIAATDIDFALAAGLAWVTDRCHELAKKAPAESRLERPVAVEQTGDQDVPAIRGRRSLGQYGALSGLPGLSRHSGPVLAFVQATAPRAKLTEMR